ncbi:MAG: glycosyltransferase, partial [Prevotella sp.]|nr:glycosyltransferase [Prevotella sp.]
IYYPDEKIAKQNTAVFAGSWYNQHPDRCKQMTKLFDFVLDHDIELIIYDRKSGTGHTSNQYPKKYSQYIRSAVSFDQLGDIFRKCRYAININTVTDSETMFARRVYEAMACGCIIISNESKGLRKTFEKKIWF